MSSNSNALFATLASDVVGTAYKHTLAKARNDLGENIVDSIHPSLLSQLMNEVYHAMEDGKLQWHEVLTFIPLIEQVLTQQIVSCALYSADESSNEASPEPAEEHAPLASCFAPSKIRVKIKSADELLEFVTVTDYVNMLTKGWLLLSQQGMFPEEVDQTLIYAAAMQLHRLKIAQQALKGVQKALGKACKLLGRMACGCV